MNEARLPDGIDARHVHGRAGTFSGHWPVGLIVLGAVLGAALVGAFGSDLRLLAQNEAISLKPDPSGHDYRDGAFRFRFGRLAAGDTLVVKVDAQINSGRPPSWNSGAISVADGDTPLATVNYTMRVLP